MACELSVGCPYFNAQGTVPPRTAAMFKARYCRTRNVDCARYSVYSRFGRNCVPDDLPPNENLRALAIMRSQFARAV